VKILVIHQYYLLPGQPGGSRFNQMARYWAERGHAVTVVAGNHNYVTNHVPEQFRGRWAVRTDDGKVTVWRCHVPSSYNSGAIGRMWAFAGFVLSGLSAACRAETPDVIITTSPPLTVAIIGWVLRRLRFRRAKWVFEVRDLWPESAVSTGVLAGRSLLTRALYALEAAAYRWCDRINVLTPAFREDIVGRRLATPAHIALIPNAADLDTFVPADRDNEFRTRFGWGQRFVLLYAGAHGRANAVGQLVDAAERLRERSGIVIATAGDGPEKAGLENRARALGLSNMMFLGPIPKEQMPALVNAADVGVAVLQDNATFRTVYPNKVFDYMACARPILLSIDGVARTLVCDQARAGVFAPPEDAAAIADAITWLAAHPAECQAMGARGREWVVRHASREALAGEYLDVLQALIAPDARSAASLGERRRVES
jgi:glycosyltransferase involved in cell wall biosynthesis